MSSTIKLRSFIKYFFSILFCLVYRFLHIFPNNDPIMAFVLPYSKKDNVIYAVIFAVFSMVLFDIITMKVGIWTIVTSLTYGGIALLFSFYFKKFSGVSLKKYAFASIIGILIFDFVTGPIMSSYTFNIPFVIALIGQIPFTLMHLASGVSLTLLLSPVLDKDIRKQLFSVKKRLFMPTGIFGEFSAKINSSALIVLILAGFLFILLGCVQQTANFSEITQQKVLDLKKIDFSYSSSDGQALLTKTIYAEEGANIFDLLKKEIDFGYDTYPSGPFITSINGMKPPAGQYLALYVDGNYAEKGISDYYVSNDIKIEFKNEVILDFS